MKFEQAGNGYIAKNDKGDKVAEITYSPAGDQFVIADHTCVAKELEGQGIAGQLLDHLVTEMDKQGKKIMPLCPYVVRKFEKEPEKYDFINYNKHK